MHTTSPLTALRQWLQDNQLDGMIVPRADAWQSESCAPYDAKLAWLTGFGVALAVAKVLVEVTLFVASYQVQRSFVFGRPATSRIAPTEEGRQLVSSR